MGVRLVALVTVAAFAARHGPDRVPETGDRGTAFTSEKEFLGRQRKLKTWR